MKHWGKVNRGKIVKCKHCGKEFITILSNRPNSTGRKFCSRDCKKAFYNKPEYRRQFASYTYEYRKEKTSMINKVLADSLSDQYVIDVIRARSTLTRDDIRKYPEWIKTKREQLKLVRATSNN